jgi:Ca2+-transporting ATPase
VSDEVRDAAPPHAATVDAVLRRWEVDPARGLTREEVIRRLALHGPNRLPDPPRPSRLLRFASQFTSPLVLVLVVAAAVAAGLALRGTGGGVARFGDAIAILAIVVLNAALGFAQEEKAAAALDALRRALDPTARVRRDGEEARVPADSLVPGDVVVVEAGDLIAADLRLIAAADLAVDESALTGESLPVSKDPRAAVAPAAAPGDRPTMLFLGTTAVRGRATAVAVATGVDTEFGRIGALLATASTEDTPLAKRLAAFGRQVLWLCLAVSAALVALGVFVRDRRLSEVLVEAISFAVAVIPEGLPAITTIVLALGMQRMAKCGAIVRRLPAVETLGAATVLCTDKTGTLTENAMTVRAVWCDGQRFEVSGEGYTPSGSVTGPDGVVTHEAVPPVLRLVVESGVICNDAAFREEGGERRLLGDPTEGALLVLAEKAGVRPMALRERHARIDERPFSPERQRMTAVTRSGDGVVVAHVKGSVESVLSLCTHVARADGSTTLDDRAREGVQAEALAMAQRALRVLAVARRDSPGDEPEEALTFLGLVGMMDPPRVGVAGAIEACHRAGVRVVMITGDHPGTAAAIAREIGLPAGEGAVITGAELAAMSDDALAARLPEASVFARTSPEQKLRIVRAFKATGEVVAMTGDGVNDAPALREAHIGVAMGRSGTDVARAAADLVLTDDRFTTLVDAVREGRAIWSNLQKSVVYLLSSNVALAVTVFATVFDPTLLALTPLMILCINLVTNGPPAVALGVDPPSPDQMEAPPRRPDEPLLSRRELALVVSSGLVMAAAALSARMWVREPQAVRAMMFAVLGFGPLFHVWNCRSERTSLFALSPRAPWPLVLAVLASASIHALGLVVPALRPTFHSATPAPWQWGLVASLAALIVPAVELGKVGWRLIPDSPRARPDTGRKAPETLSQVRNEPTR